jgi:hypothetical protein
MQRWQRRGGAELVGERPGVVEAAAQVGVLKLPDLVTEGSERDGQRSGVGWRNK